MLSETNKPKIDWATFEEYHNEVMAFIDLTQEQLRNLKNPPKATTDNTRVTDLSMHDETDINRLTMSKFNTTFASKRLTQALATGLKKTLTAARRNTNFFHLGNKPRQHRQTISQVSNSREL